MIDTNLNPPNQIQMKKKKEKTRTHQTKYTRKRKKTNKTKTNVIRSFTINQITLYATKEDETERVVRQKKM